MWRARRLRWAEGNGSAGASTTPAWLLTARQQKCSESGSRSEKSTASAKRYVRDRAASRRSFAKEPPSGAKQCTGAGAGSTGSSWDGTPSPREPGARFPPSPRVTCVQLPIAPLLRCDQSRFVHTTMGFEISIPGGTSLSYFHSAAGEGPSCFTPVPLFALKGGTVLWYAQAGYSKTADVHSCAKHLH